MTTNDKAFSASICTATGTTRGRLIRVRSRSNVSGHFYDMAPFRYQNVGYLNLWWPSAIRLLSIN